MSWTLAASALLFAAALAYIIVKLWRPFDAPRAKKD